MKNIDAVPPPLTAPSPPTAPLRRPVPHHAPFLVYKRIAVLGARGVGKSALSIRCTQNRFEPDYMQTFQDMYQWKPVVSGVHYDVSIDDTDGQDESSEFGLRYTTGVDGYLLIFSVRDESSFEVIKAVNEKLLDTLNVLERVGTAEVPRVLVGNQIDVTHERQVPRAVAQRWADSQGIPYLESSAFTPYNAEEVFKEVLHIIQRNLRDSHTSRPVHRGSDVELPPNQSKQSCSVQ